MTINQNTTKINTIKNTTLPELLQKINSLPNAGSGGGSVETWTGTIYGAQGVLGSIPDLTYYYIDETFTLRYATLSKGTSQTVTIMANTLVGRVSGDVIGNELTDYNDSVIVCGYYNSAEIFAPTKNNFVID